jgi:hypothetical protein
MLKTSRLLFFFFVPLLIGCEKTDDKTFIPRGTGEGSGGDTDTVIDTSDPQSTNEDPGSTNEPGPTSSICDAADFAISIVPVRLMILLDASGSMTVGDPTRWDQALAAIREMLVVNEDAAIEFGFDAFPDDGYCGVTTPVLADTEPGSSSKILALLDSIEEPAGGAQTPLCRAMVNYVKPKYAPNFSSTDAESYLLLVSDGDDNCGGPPTQPCGGVFTGPNLGKATSDLLTEHGIRTFVIGFGDGATSKLNNIAAAGGTPFNKYIPAANQSQLQDALITIAGTVVSCTFEIGEPDASADPDQVNLFFDDTVIGYDEDCAQNKGWSWADASNTRIELCEAACEELRGGTVKNVRAEFGCPSVPVY